MTYIDILNAFWNWRQFNIIPHSAADLFYCILDFINAARWEDKVTIPNSRITGRLDMTEKSLYSARNTLVQSSLIEYRHGKKGQAGTYKINLTTLYNFTNKRSDLGSNVGSNKGSNSGVIGGTYKEKDIEQDKSKNNIPPLPPKGGKSTKSKKFTPEQMILEFTDDTELQEALRDFVSMRKGIRKPLITERAFRGILNELSRLSDSTAEQVQLVNMAVERNWLTVYKSEDRQQGNTKGNNSTGNYFARVARGEIQI